MLVGLELGRGHNPHAALLGTTAELDADSGILTLSAPAQPRF